MITSTTPGDDRGDGLRDPKQAVRRDHRVEPALDECQTPDQIPEDPEKVFGEAENVHTIVRRGFEADYPEVAKFLRQFKWKPADLDSLSLMSYECGGDFDKAAANG